MPSSLPARQSIEAERERRYAALLRRWLEELADPRWPAWPAEADVDHHRWVRAHWTVEACDEFDLRIAHDYELDLVELHELCYELVACREDADCAREQLERLGLPIWPSTWQAPWWEYYQPWPPPAWGDGRINEHARHFLREMWGAVRSLGYRPEYVEQMGQSNRLSFERRWSRAHEELLAELRDSRICGIRGRYRLMQTVWEKKRGITEADIDAP